jgi:hypothetical protein
MADSKMSENAGGLAGSLIFLLIYTIFSSNCQADNDPPNAAVRFRTAQWKVYGFDSRPRHSSAEAFAM